MILNEKSKQQVWLVPLLLISVLAYLGRGVIQYADPNYWRPQTTLDYVAVILTSTAFLTHAGILSIMLGTRFKQSDTKTKIWKASMLIAIFGFTLSGLGNLIEDALDIRDIGGFLFTSGIAGPIGLLLSFLAALLLPELRRRWAWFLALPMAAFVITFDFSGLIIGPGMLFMAFLEQRRKQGTPQIE